MGRVVYGVIRVAGMVRLSAMCGMSDLRGLTYMGFMAFVLYMATLCRAGRSISVLSVSGMLGLAVDGVLLKLRFLSAQSVRIFVTIRASVAAVASVVHAAPPGPYIVLCCEA
jgi:hypothetical protein